jgi:protein-S-isoprenylcysteine O-methyltransferase Ste14
MTRTTGRLVRFGLMAIVWVVLWQSATARLPASVDLAVIAGGLLLVLPAAWLGRRVLDRDRSPAEAGWTTTFVHFSLGFLLGVPLVRAIVTHAGWPGPSLSVPAPVGLGLVVATGAAFLLVVANLAVKGLGAPFFIALSRKVATEWLYARTRNPMVLAGLAFLLSLGVWFDSLLFVLWAGGLFGPALLMFVKVYEERELELRFGRSYLEYKSKTPMLFPRKV